MSPLSVRKQLKEPDQLEKTMKLGFSKVENYAKPAIAGSIVLAIVGLGWVLWNEMHSRTEAKGESALYEAMKVAETENKPEDESFKPMDVEATYPKTLEALKKVIEGHSGTQAANEASTKIGVLFFRHQQFEKALPWFETAAKEASLPMMKSMAYLNLGLTQENLNQCESAVASFDKGLSQKDPTSKAELLLSRARCMEVLNQKDEAKKIYDQILTEFPESAYARTAEMHRSQL